MSSNFQLTKFPVGTIREVWSMSWPLMLGLISNSLMIFVDRLLLSWHDPAEFNAVANAGMASYVFLVLPISVCAISEVLVGRLHGEGRSDEIAKPVWQMIWFSLMLTMPMLLISYYAPALIFYQTGNELNETTYFKVLIRFAPILCMMISLSGFFIGIGKVKIVSRCVIAGNLINIFLGYLLIFGGGPIPSLGIFGAALATGISQVFQAIVLLGCFLSKGYRHEYNTTQFDFNLSYFREALRIGTPSGLGHAIEVVAHFIFFRIVMMAGSEQLTVAALVQSFYLLFGFVCEALSKGVGAIVANLIGAREFVLIKRVFWSAIKLHTLFFSVIFGMMWLFPDVLLNLFFSSENSSILLDPSLKILAAQAMLWMGVFFLFDGFSWILIGQLTAAGDVKFIFYVSIVINWLVYVLPVYLLIGWGGKGANYAWMIIALSGMVNFMIYFQRYYSGKWLQEFQKPKNDDWEELPDVSS
ncbi:MAG: MATE family efflux transporter [Parachlamydiaceae bacterium]|nr:MATE family efflux transporter [Parachlamydiaceae bacterium]